MEFLQWEISCYMRMNTDDLGHIKFSQFCEKRIKMRRLIQKVSSKIEEILIKFEKRSTRNAQTTEKQVRKHK
jgi:hypothetical protein